MLRLWLLTALLSGKINKEVATKYYGVRAHLYFLVKVLLLLLLAAAAAHNISTEA